MYAFQSTRPARGATCRRSATADGSDSVCFNPRAPRGARHGVPPAGTVASKFQSTRPARGATPRAPMIYSDIEPFQSTRPARGATMPRSGFTLVNHAFCFNPRARAGARRAVNGKHRHVRRVSIHAPRAGRDARVRDVPPDSRAEVSIHAPRAGRDSQFPRQPVPRRRCDVSIHAPRGGRDNKHAAVLTVVRCFNPRAPRGARSRNATACAASVLDAFQSTRPARGATVFPPVRTAPDCGFNPRAPRGARRRRATSICQGFNPRAPRGARRRSTRDDVCAKFQSTRPARGATPAPRQQPAAACFKPRAPWGARPTAPWRGHPAWVFQSTRPARGATIRFSRVRRRRRRRVSIHAPRAGRDRAARANAIVMRFNPRARGGRDSGATGMARSQLFQSTRPRGARPRRAMQRRA